MSQAPEVDPCKKPNCRKHLLAGREACKVVCCEHCRVAEISVGAPSPRLERDAFESLVVILAEARQRLHVLEQRPAVAGRRSGELVH